MDKESIKRLDDFMDYWCKYKCPRKDEVADISVVIGDVDYECECECPKCGESFTEYGKIYGNTIDYNAELIDDFGRYLEDLSACDDCPIEQFVEQLKSEV